MKRFLSILVAGLLVGGAFAEDYSDCFVPGETMEFKIYWMGIPIAWSKTSTDMVVEEGRELFHITMVAQSYATFKHIYEVDDKTEVWIDPETALPVRHDWIINEGSIQKSQLTTFYHDKKIAIFQDRITKDIRDIAIEDDTQEIFSFIYANRNMELERLAEQKHQLLVTGKLYDLGVKITDRDKIKVEEHGKVPSVEIAPEAEFDGIFLREGKMFFWVSEQKRRVITSVKAKVAVGNITAKLQTVSGKGPGFWEEKE